MSRSLEVRRAEILNEITELGPAMPGSLVARHNRCRRPGCRCHDDPPQLHGPYLAWTRKIDGKTVTRSVSPEQAEHYRPWFDNARRLHELVDRLRQLAIEQARTEGHWPST